MCDGLVVHIIWNQYLERWVLKDMLNANIFELPDCQNFRRLFQNADKSKDNCYILKSEFKPNKEKV